MEDYIRKHGLIKGDLQHPVALCALWKDLTKVSITADDLKNASLIGNLYTPRGINILLRTLWRLPSIRYLALWGPDVTRTGETMLSLWENGLDHNYTINGSQVQLDETLPRQAIYALHRNVQLIDLRPERHLSEVMASLQRLPPRPPFAEPRIYPEAEPIPPQTFPSLGIGYRVEADTVAHAWLDILSLVLRYGQTKPSERRLAQKEILSLLTVVRAEDPIQPRLTAYLPFSHADLAVYYPQVVTDTTLDGRAYTYGNRLRAYFGHDQIAAMIARLREADFTRRAVAVLWDGSSDVNDAHPPCLTQIVANAVAGQLFFTYIARSQDMFDAWPQNTLAMLQLQKEITAACGLSLGPMASLSVSAHVYEHRWAKAEEILNIYHSKTRPLDIDPRGNFVIRVERGAITVELLSPQGDRVLWQARGASAEALGKEMARLRMASVPMHWLYLGRELQRAEDALRQGRLYVQERA